MVIKKYLLLVSSISVLFCLSGFSQQTFDVYSQEIPWSDAPISNDPNKIYSISEALNLASAGDEILVHEGIYREKITVTKNNITIRNFQNDYVLVSGAEVVSGWTDASGMASGVKMANITHLNIETDYTQLFANGEEQMMARHPNNTSGKMMQPLVANSGYASLTNISKESGSNGNGYATLTGDPIPNVDISGAIFRGLTGKMRNYVFGRVTAKSGNNITFKGLNNGPWTSNGTISNSTHKFAWGYVLHKNLIDVPGEWFVEGNTIFYMPPVDQSINDMRIEVQVRERVLVLNNTSGATIQGINFVAGNADMRKTSNATMKACSMRHLYPFWVPTGYGQSSTDQTGIYLENSSGNSFEDMYVGHSWGNMFTLKGGQNNSFENCVIEDLGWIAVFTSSIHINGSNNTNISKCTFGDAGRFQIRMDGGDAKVNIMDCDFYGSMKMGEDAGPIEATSTGRIGALNLKGGVIAYNKVHDVLRIPVSDAGYSKQKVTAFYMEDTENYTAHHNLVYNLKQTNYTGPENVTKDGSFLYLGPRYNAMDLPVNYYNNTVWNYDKCIGIWHIEINNWQSLGLNHTGGRMADGHFVNNIFMDGTEYGMTWNKKNISSTGSMGSNVSVSNPPHINTANFNTYVNHCAKQNYHFNPSNNVMISNASNNFANASGGDFNLLQSSVAKNSGMEIQGVTSTTSPDCGALEGGDRVLFAGASLAMPTFWEKGESEPTDPVDPVVEVAGFSSFVATVEQRANYTFNVDYVAAEERHVVVGITAPDGTWLANGKQIVQTGKGTANITVNLPELPEPGADYLIVASIRPVGGNGTTNIAAETQYLEITGVITSLSKGQKRQTIYPNPTTGKLHLPSTLESWQVYNLSGVKVFETKETELDMSNYPKGLYFFRSGDVLHKVQVY